MAAPCSLLEAGRWGRGLPCGGQERIRLQTCLLISPVAKLHFQPFLCSSSKAPVGKLVWARSRLLQPLGGTLVVPTQDESLAPASQAGPGQDPKQKQVVTRSLLATDQQNL